MDKQDSKFEVFNVGNGSSISVNDLVEKTIEHSGKDLKVDHDLSKPSIKTKLCLNNSKAKSLLGWKPMVSLDEGIQKTMEWYKRNAKNV
jgi:nucleoside-diphosphate-sugar epimerase